MKRIHILKPGTFKAKNGIEYTFSAEQLAEMASSYDPALSEAPLVIGHPTETDKAYGWAKSLMVDADGLFVNPHQVCPEFSEMAKKGEYKKVSGSFFAPDAPGNPTPGKYYLRHVGFLGAKPPAITGLRPVEFSADDAGKVIEFAEMQWYDFSAIGRLFRNLRDFLIGEFGQEKADRAMQTWDITQIEQAAVRADVADPKPVLGFSEATVTAPTKIAEFAARETALGSREAAIKKREDELAAIDAAAARKSHAEFAADLVGKGQLLPRDEAFIVELCSSLNAEHTVEFSAGDGKTAKVGTVAQLKTFLQGLPKQVEFKELAPASAEAQFAAEFSAPDGASVNAEQLAVLGKAQAHMREHKCDFITAVKAVSPAA